MEKVSVLASGGLDSSVLIAKLAADAEVHPIYVRCGLAWEDAELAVLRLFIDALKKPNVTPVIELSAPAAALYGDHWSVTGKGVPAADEPDENTYLPGRNILLISLAAIWGSTHGVSRIAIGSLGGNPFPDATTEFFESFGRDLSTGIESQGCHRGTAKRLSQGRPDQGFQGPAVAIDSNLHGARWLDSLRPMQQMFRAPAGLSQSRRRRSHRISQLVVSH